MILGIFKHPKLVCAVVFIAVMASREYVVQLELEREREAVWNRALAEASILRASIEGDLNSTIYLGIGLSGYLSLGPDLTDASVTHMLETICSQGKHVRNIGLAPDNTIRFVYPREGNEAAIGLRYEDLADQWPGVLEAIEKKTTVVAGPISLVQGGYGIVTRTPVFLQDGAYWGIVSMVVDVDGLLEEMVASHTSLEIEWALRAATAGAESRPYIFGDVDLFEGDPIEQSIELPGGTWDIGIVPTGPWSERLLRMQLLRRLFSLLITTVIVLLVYMVLHERAQIHHLAVHDPMTGLPNRHLLFERLEQRIALAARYSSTFCLVFVDLDRFKPINDQYGHRAGDTVLTETGLRMVAAVRASDTVARVGGDEFVVLLPDTADMSGAKAVGRNLLKAIDQPIKTEKGFLSVSASIGFSVYPEHGTTAEELLAHADEAMYTEKLQDRTESSRSSHDDDTAQG